MTYSSDASSSLHEDDECSSSNFYKIYKNEASSTPNTLNELAHSIYNQLETLIALYGKSAGRDFMPIIVNLLEKMEESERMLNETRKISTEHYEESVSLKKLLQTEKALRLQAEQNLFYMEEELEEERENMMRYISCADLYSIKLEKRLIKTHGNTKKHPKVSVSVNSVDKVYADIAELKTRIFGANRINVNVLKNSRLSKRSFDDVDETDSKTEKAGSQNSEYLTKKLSTVSASDAKSAKFTRHNSTMYSSAKIPNLKELQKLTLESGKKKSDKGNNNNNNSDYSLQPSMDDSFYATTKQNTRHSALLEYDAGSMSVDTSHYSLHKKSQNDGERLEKSNSKKNSRQNKSIDMSQICLMEEREEAYLHASLQNDELREKVKGLLEQNSILKEQIVGMEEKMEQSESVLKQFDKYCDMYCSQIENLSERVKKYENSHELNSQVSSNKAVYRLERKVEKYKAQIEKYKKDLNHLTGAVNWYLQFNLVEHADRVSNSYSPHYVNTISAALHNNHNFNKNNQNTSSPVNMFLNKANSMDTSSSEPASGVKKVTNFFRRLFKQQTETYVVSGSSSPFHLNAHSNARRNNFGVLNFGRDLVDAIDTCFCRKTFVNAFSRFFTLGKLYENFKEEAVSSVLVVCKEKPNHDGNTLTTIQFVNVDNTISAEFDAEAQNDPVTAVKLVEDDFSSTTNLSANDELHVEKTKYQNVCDEQPVKKSLWVAFKSGLLLVYNVESLTEKSTFIDGGKNCKLIARLFLKAPAACIANYNGKVVVSTVDGRLLLFEQNENSQMYNFGCALVYDLKEPKNSVRSIVLGKNGEFWMAGRESKILIFSTYNNCFKLKNEFDASPHKARIIKMLTTFCGKSDRYKYIAGLFKMSTIVSIYDVDNYTHIASIECLPWLMTRFPNTPNTTSMSNPSFVHCCMVNYNLFISTSIGVVFCIQLDKELAKSDDIDSSFIEKTGGINREKFLEAYKNYKVLRYRHYGRVAVLCTFYYSDSKIVLATAGHKSEDQFSTSNLASTSIIFEGSARKHETESKNTTVNLYMV